MATKKTVKEEMAEEIQAEQLREIEQEEAAEDPWQQTEQLYVPKKPKGEDPQYYVCVNDRRYVVPANGKTQELPLPVAEILKTALKDEEAAEEFAEHIPNERA